MCQPHSWRCFSDPRSSLNPGRSTEPSAFHSAPIWDGPSSRHRCRQDKLAEKKEAATRSSEVDGMAELLCLEKDVDFQERPEGQGPVCSYRDPAIFDDAAVLDNLLRSEERYSINPRYFACVQKELSTNMRRIVGRWMLEVCEVELCRPEVYPLAMNCLDRFLSVRPVRKCQLQLTGAVCMLLASKFRQTKPLSLERLCMFTDHSVTRQEIKRREMRPKIVSYSFSSSPLCVLIDPQFVFPRRRAQRALASVSFLGNDGRQTDAPPGKNFFTRNDVHTLLASRLCRRLRACCQRLGSLCLDAGFWSRGGVAYSWLSFRYCFDDVSGPLQLHAFGHVLVASRQLL
ncbi:hypothetical protein HPB48_013329 [Haemaphysalis longicornis]|uniref:Cyclin-like domain-containing protein n=1 Tax=Haemaphysalis longicornis TaxID=44386 RepID=A0A9J6GQ64_HAELO|nr:hypothetical protein HPB48_013329 [Haemaphysalis longicornis]